VLTKDFDVVHQVEKIAPNRWRNRTRHEELLVRGTVVAIRPGADNWIECQFSLWKSAHDRADEFEALCLELLADW
jgi:hypothetical protein